jgi:hypothetical protein
MMKEAFVALVGVHMLAELVDDEKLRQALLNMPTLPQWSEVRQVIAREVCRRNRRSLKVATRENTCSEDAA